MRGKTVACLEPDDDEDGDCGKDGWRFFGSVNGTEYTHTHKHTQDRHMRTHSRRQ